MTTYHHHDGRQTTRDCKSSHASKNGVNLSSCALAKPNQLLSTIICLLNLSRNAISDDRRIYTSVPYFNTRQQHCSGKFVASMLFNDTASNTCRTCYKCCCTSFLCNLRSIFLIAQCFHENFFKMAMRNAKRYSVEEVVADLIANSDSEDDFMDLACPRSPDHSDTGGEISRIRPRHIFF
jgi:hypothetical protein